MGSEKKIVVPGDFLGEKKGRKLGTGVYQEGEKVFSSVLGIPKITNLEISVIPFSGIYMPRKGDMVIGKIKSVEVSGWFVDINSPYLAFLPIGEALKEYVDLSQVDLSSFFAVDDVIYCMITKVTQDKIIQVSMKRGGAKKIETGVLIQVIPTKVPRIIGRGASMLKLIKSKTKCNLLVGQNGVIWIEGKNAAKAIEAILTIEKESHVEGLTNKIEKMLSGS
jgi:exosome complex component RRP4